jgi:hypothetical protein
MRIFDLQRGSDSGTCGLKGSLMCGFILLGLVCVLVSLWESLLEGLGQLLGGSDAGAGRAGLAGALLACIGLPTCL